MLRLESALSWSRTLEFLRWPHNCLACAVVMVEFLRLMASVFPRGVAYATRSLIRMSGCLPTSVRHLSRIEVHSQDETLPEQFVTRSSVESWLMMMEPTVSESFGLSLVQRMSPSRI